MFFTNSTGVCCLCTVLDIDVCVYCVSQKLKLLGSGVKAEKRGFSRNLFQQNHSNGKWYN